jgi:hypothetical protein
LAAYPNRGHSLGCGSRCDVSRIRVGRKAMMNSDASALVLLTVLAWARLLASTWLLAYCVVGVVLACTVPAIAWLEEATAAPIGGHYGALAGLRYA